MDRGWLEASGRSIPKCWTTAEFKVCDIYGVAYCIWLEVFSAVLFFFHFFFFSYGSFYTSALHLLFANLFSYSVIWGRKCESVCRRLRSDGILSTLSHEITMAKKWTSILINTINRMRGVTFLGSVGHIDLLCRSSLTCL